jgi:hypothetical protein
LLSKVGTKLMTRHRWYRPEIFVLESFLKKTLAAL